MKIKNPFHRATDVEKHQKSLANLKGEGRSLKSEIRRTTREIARANANKAAATRRGDFKEAKAAIIERKKLEHYAGTLQGSVQMVSEASRTVRHVQTQAVVNRGLSQAFKTVEKSLKNAGQTDKTMEKWEKMNEHMEERAGLMDDMLDTVNINADAEAEADDEIRQLADSMGESTVQPIRENTAPVYEEAEPIEEEL